MRSETELGFRHRHLLGIGQLDENDIIQVLDLADSFLRIGERAIKKVPTLRGRTVLNVFLEASTRTRVSFEIAGKRMSADTINISGSASSTQKGETVLDTARNLMAMNPDVVVLRHYAAGAPAMIAKYIDAAVINAGDGAHEHPTQALLDCATIRRAKGKVHGLEVAIVGDIDHSRVARSNILALTRLGARVRLCAPATLIPRGIEQLGGDATRERVSVHHRLESALEGADVVMMLRIQNERMSGQTPRFANNREYARYFGLSARTLEYSRPDAIVMHPGPINRGVEMMPDIADGSRSVILDQVTYGVAVRMAVLYLLGGGTRGDAV
ncbi:aspartate carbamoyltransferase catalytic subunit [Haliangium ochraceum]|uniref:Aspartate carbamoyltransferase n=1 Tax=Haliangium ochraceum (strain DSM 14365 / JCM 11303 / SMP-2) TaxID=502025 RepID=D0LXQ4_HALO1|nr:aspartate carbamoyltransferase catalytic subunit [Haliangium ochraceum]ACY17809.1 aspartate carbamoyltransferase [Haliangium ochraceum DSM 14365]